MANSSDTTNQGGKMERNYKDDGSSTKDETDWRSKEVEYMRFKTTQNRSTTTMNISTHKSERQV